MVNNAFFLQCENLKIAELTVSDYNLSTNARYHLLYGYSALKAGPNNKSKNRFNINSHSHSEPSPLHSPLSRQLQFKCR